MTRFLKAGTFGFALHLAHGHAACPTVGILGEFKRISGSPRQPFGDEIRRGARLAASRRCVRYDFIDIDNSLANVGGAIERAVGRGIRVFVGLGTSDQALAAVPALYKTGSLLISPTSSATSPTP